MKFQKNFFEDERKVIFVILGISIFERIISNLYFVLKNGTFSTNEVEIWVFTGIAKGVFSLGKYDVTNYILRIFGFLPVGYALYGVTALSAILFSLSSLLIYLILKKVQNKEIGFFSAIIYSSLVQTMYFSTISFTHDSVQLLLILLTLYTFVIIFERETLRKRAIFGGLTIVLLLISREVNENYLVSLQVMAMYLGYNVLKRFSKEKEIFYYYVSFLLIAAIFLKLTFVSNFEELLSFFPEAFKKSMLKTYLSGSADLQPTSFERFLYQYHIFLVFTILGIYHSLKEKNLIGISFLILGFFYSLIILRGTRIFDIGVSMICGNFFFYVKEKLLEIKATKKFIVTFFSILILLNFSISFLFFSKLPRTTHDEFMALKWLGENSKDGKIYATWAEGNFLLVVSGRKPVLTHTKLNKEIERIFVYEDEDKAYEELKKLGVRYVYVTEKAFRISGFDRRTGEAKVRISSSLFALLKRGMSFQDYQKLLIYRFLYDEKTLKNFKKIYEDEDDVTGYLIKIFELVPPPNKQKV